MLRRVVFVYNDFKSLSDYSITELFSDNKWKMKIAIVGSGVVGLTTALELQNEYRNAQISIIADKFYKETTSYVAAGIFRPGF